ncbi:DUF2972 domain-containing protein [Campylobacter sp. W0018]|uniref:DUF2972 domain-containing protein n=1 Tax=Campylobacter sp. W0018 TaxID=2735782 RepID=UPI00301DB83F|nr:DUF2972 domain-containing protein [Campylobacter sp. W0018]
MYYYYSENIYIPSLNEKSFLKIFENYEGYFTLNKRLNFFKNKIENIECLEFSDINCENAFNTFKRLAYKYNFTLPSDPKIFQGRVNRNQGDLLVLPVTLNVRDDIKIIITTYQIHPNKNNFLDITSEIFQNRTLLFDNIILLINQQEYEILKNNQKLYQESKIYLNDYMDALEKHEMEIKKHLISEDQILQFLKENKELRIRLKEIIDEDLTYVRENHPEHLKKWKCYQEFEKMCEELDG